MRWVALAALAGACGTTAPSDLEPLLGANAYDTRLEIYASVDADADVDVSATFRGNAVPLMRLDSSSDQLYDGFIALDEPVASDEPVSIEINGVTVTLTAPAAWSSFDVPLFISRSMGGTIAWTPASPDPGAWMTEEDCAKAVAQDVAPGATSIVLTSADFPPRYPGDDAGGGTCTSTLRLDRARDAEPDPRFGGGRAGFYRVHTIQFALTP